MVTNEFLNELSTALKVDAEKLKTAKSFSELNSPVMFLSEEDKRTLEGNVKKIGYDEGKRAAVEMLNKQLKKTYTESDNDLLKTAFSEANSIEEVLIKISDVHSKKLNELKETYSKDATTQIDQRIGEWREKYVSLEGTYTKEKRALQDLLQSKVSDYETKLNELQNQYFRKEIDTHLLENLRILEFPIPEMIKTKGENSINDFVLQRQKDELTLFNAYFDTKKDDKGQIIHVNKTTGEPMLNNLQNPLSTAEVIQKFAAQRGISLKANRTAGRGEGDSQTSNFAGVKEISDFPSYFKINGINPNSAEAGKIVANFLKNKS